MRSKILWMTDLGLVKISSGELSPGLDPIELRFYPRYGWGINEWDFEAGVLNGEYPLEYIIKEEFVNEGNFFRLKIKFKKLVDKSKICILANHVPTNFKQNIWEGDILPNHFDLKTKHLGLTNKNLNVSDLIKDIYPNINFLHFPIHEIKVVISNFTIIASEAKSVEEHNAENCPILFKGFHPKQVFSLDVYGHLFGYGGMGGDAGISTVTDEVDIIYPTNAKNGGNVVFVEYKTQSLNIYVHHGATYLPGQGGKGASAFLINCPEKRINQIGQPGLGGYPNGLNGKFTDIHYKLKLIKENVKSDIMFLNKHDYCFISGKVVAHVLPLFMSANVSVSKSKDGKNGIYTPKGVTKLVNNGNAFGPNQLVYIYGGYMSN